jgi:hypothetical protein
MKRFVKATADHSLQEEQRLLNLSVYEFYFHLESLKKNAEK